MNIDNTSSFSKRHGLEPSDVEITIREGAPEWLRDFVIALAYECGFEPKSLRSVLCRLLLESPNANNWSEFPNIDSEVRGLIGKADWFRVYDLAETIAETLKARYDHDALKRFTEGLNNAFRRKGIGWQFVDGRIEIRGEESFEQSVRTAITVTQKSGRAVAGRELHEALHDLSKRPSPDITGAIQHAMAALECVSRDVSGDQNATLGALIKRNSGLFPAPLDKGVEKIWGYASEQGRHLREGSAPQAEEAELVVGLAGTLVTYLVKKTPSNPRPAGFS